MKTIKTCALLTFGLMVLASCNKETTKSEEKEIEITVDQLPQVVKDNINRSYAGCTMTEADEITHEGGKITYDVELTLNGKTTEVMYDTEGNFLGEEIDDEDEPGKDDDKETGKED